eukprot:CAMPEP_0168463112 /NCGR_PEP_ID=MMETSP0228-20121227/54882_1 /TAXON_ID=133427 /ORGANISM="Protoceratium reticulatum, Strain CCCM 535 (=CCMP 1889)" /LENGTH=125 /DNA_ID=CAMNT_0008478547 /DNA_START=32 /DNA_END=406 /DNA_ORIENTATION=-
MAGNADKNKIGEAFALLWLQSPNGAVQVPPRPSCGYAAMAAPGFRCSGAGPPISTSEPGGVEYATEAVADAEDLGENVEPVDGEATGTTSLVPSMLWNSATRASHKALLSKDGLAAEAAHPEHRR